MSMPRVLTIAGSDSGGGAGIQADLKTFTVLGVYGMTAITALTAQNTCGVSGIHAVPPEFVGQQIDAVATDIGVDAVKTGMLANAAIVGAVANAVRRHGVGTLVVDPVMVAESGAALLDGEARAVLLDELVPLATIVTPNIHEASALTGIEISSVTDLVEAARALIARGARACLVKGGHLHGDTAVDVFADGCEVRELVGERIPSRLTHGTGCQLSAAIAAFLAHGLTLGRAVERAKEFIEAAIRGGLAIGHGAGPANPLAWLARRQ